MLFGEHSPAIDTQYRISIPAKFRTELGEQFIIVRKLKSTCLRIYSPAAWDEYMLSLKGKLTRGAYEKILFQYYRKAVQAVPDSLGRVRVPKDLWESIGVSFDEGADREVVVIGCGEFGEIWSKNAYEAFINELDEDELSAEIEGCEI